MKLLSRVWLFVTPWTVAYQDPQSMGFSRQEYWSGLPFPSPGDLPDPGLPHCRQTLYRLSHQGSPSLDRLCLWLWYLLWPKSYLRFFLKWNLLSHVRLCNPVDNTVHGILQVRILEWVAFPFSRGSSQSRDRTQVSSIAARFFTSWPTGEALSSI